MTRDYILLRKSYTWYNAGINFIINHPSPGEAKRNDSKGAKTLTTGQSLCRPPQDKTGSQKPHLRNLKLENFTDVFLNINAI